MASPVEVIIGGRRISDFETVKVSASIESLAWNFELITAPTIARGIPLGSVFEVYAEPRSPRERLLLRGWIEELESSLGGESTRATLKGRSRSGILLDCSALHDPGEWLNADLITIANELASPYGVSVFLDSTDQAKNGPFPAFDKFALEEGETVFEALERMLRRVGALAFPRPGGLVVTRPSSTILNATAGENGARLVEGGNVKSSRVRLSLLNRFAEYRVRGQSRGSDLRNGVGSINDEGIATDSAVVLQKVFSSSTPPTRRRLIIADGSLSPGEAQARADFEAAVAAARAATISVEVQGWPAVPSDAYSDLWLPNFQVPTEIPSQGIDETFLITAVDYSASSSGGSSASLTLRRPDSFLPVPAVEADLDFSEFDVETEEYPESFLD